MRITRACVLSILLLVFFAVVPGLAAEKTFVTGTQMFDLLGLFGSGEVGEIIDPGTVTCPGHKPTGNPMQPCPAGSRIKIRGMIIVERVNSSDPRGTGWDTVEINADWDADYAGPIWGKFSLAVNTGGVWEGTWNGKRFRDEENLWHALLKAEGHGTGDAIEGSLLKIDFWPLSVTPMPIAYVSSFSGYILDPRAR